MNEDIKRLVEALEPFAAVTEAAVNNSPRDGEVVWRSKDPTTGDWLTLVKADFRRAREALASLTSKETDHG